MNSLILIDVALVSCKNNKEKWGNLAGQSSPSVHAVYARYFVVPGFSAA
jgi:hypothetical protein